MILFQTSRHALLLAALALVAAGCNHPSAAPPAAVPAQPSPASSTPALFSDVTQSAGINYQFQIEGKRPLNILQTIGNGCAFLDYNNDGNLDILLVGPKLALYRGDGHGHFTDVTRETGLDTLKGHFLGCAVGDYDNDGYDDIYLSAYDGGMLLHNEKGQRFTDVSATCGIPKQSWGTSCAFLDYDNDGKLDLFVGNYVKFGPTTNPQLCDYNGHQSACGPRFYDGWHGKLYRNLGGGKFQDVTKATGASDTTGKVLGVACADFDGSGRMSICLANDEVPGDLLQNTGSKFQNIGARTGTAYDGSGAVHGGMGADWGDYDNDGKLDLVVATFQHEPKCIYHNDGGFFSENSAMLGVAEKSAPYVAFGVKFFDYDNNGWLDLAFANGHVQDNIALIDTSESYLEKPQLFHNLNGTSFEEASDRGGAAFQQAIMGRGLSVGDIDNDGHVDLLIVNGEGRPLLLHNDVKNDNHWLICRLEGTKSNRDGIGALLTAQAGGRKLLRQCSTDGSYMSASDRRVHFGLGAEKTATVTVKWPDGTTNAYKDIAADHVVTLKEGESAAR